MITPCSLRLNSLMLTCHTLFYKLPSNKNILLFIVDYRLSFYYYIYTYNIDSYTITYCSYLCRTIAIYTV